MANITTVNLTSGVPSGPAGPATVSTLDNLIGTTTTPCPNIQTIQGSASGAAVPVSGTVNAAQSGGWTVGVSGTVTVSGTVSALQSGTWNITNVSGVVSLPTGAATAAKQPSLGTGGAPSPDVITVQGISTGTALKVDGSAVTQPVSGTISVSGTVAVTQSGTWNVGVTGTVASAQSGTWTTRIVGNTGSVLDFNGQNQASPSALLVGGQFNTTPTTILTGNSSPLQLDSAGNLLVNVKAGGASGGTSSNFNATFPAAGTAAGAEYLSSAPTLTTGQMVALQTDINGNLKVNIVAGGAAGGTSSSFGVAFPGTGTAAGAEYLSSPPTLTSGQMVALQTNVSGSLKVDGSAVTQPVSGTITANQGGTWNITNISGTVSLPTGAATSANQPTNAALGSTTSGQTGGLALGAVTSGAPTYLTAQSNALSLTTAGALRVDGSGVTQPVSGTFWQTTQPVSGTVTVTQATAANLNATVTGTITANQGGTWTVQPGNTANTTAWLVTGTGGTFPVTGTFWQATQPISAASLPLPTGAATSANQPSAAAMGSTTAGQTGNLDLGAVTTASPAYTTGQSNALSLDTSGCLRSNSTIPIMLTGPTWNNATALNTTTAVISNNNVGTGSICGQISTTTTITGGALTFEESYDNAISWKSIPTSRLIDPITNANLANPYTLAPSTNQAFLVVDSGVTQVRVRLSTVIAGTGTCIIYTTTSPISNLVQVAAGAPIPVTGTFWQATQPVSGTVTVQQATAANLNATVSGTVTANQGGTWTVQPGNTANTTAWLVTGTGGTFPVTGTFWQATQPVSIAATVAVAGDTANAASDAGNPVKIGGLAKTTNPTAVADGQRVNGLFDKVGKMVVAGALRQLKGVQTTTITATTETTIVTAGAAGVFQDLYGLILANTSATAVNVAIKDATAGTTRVTIQVPAGDTRGFTVPVDSAVVQATAANNWTATLSAAVTSILVTALYVSNI